MWVLYQSDIMNKITAELWVKRVWNEGEVMSKLKLELYVDEIISKENAVWYWGIQWVLLTMIRYYKHPTYRTNKRFVFLSQYEVFALEIFLNDKKHNQPLHFYLWHQNFLHECWLKWCFSLLHRLGTGSYLCLKYLTL